MSSRPVSVTPFPSNPQRLFPFLLSSPIKPMPFLILSLSSSPEERFNFQIKIPVSSRFQIHYSISKPQRLFLFSFSQATPFRPHDLKDMSTCVKQLQWPNLTRVTALLVKEPEPQVGKLFFLNTWAIKEVDIPYPNSHIVYSEPTGWLLLKRQWVPGEAQLVLYDPFGRREIQVPAMPHSLDERARFAFNRKVILICVPGPQVQFLYCTEDSKEFETITIPLEVEACNNLVLDDNWVYLVDNSAVHRFTLDPHHIDFSTIHLSQTLEEEMDFPLQGDQRCYISANIICWANTNSRSLVLMGNERPHFYGLDFGLETISLESTEGTYLTPLLVGNGVASIHVLPTERGQDLMKTGHQGADISLLGKMVITRLPGTQLEVYDLNHIPEEVRQLVFREDPYDGQYSCAWVCGTL